MNDAESNGRYGSAYAGYYRDYFKNDEATDQEVPFTATVRVPDVQAPPRPTAAPRPGAGTPGVGGPIEPGQPESPEVIPQTHAETEQWLDALWTDET